MNNIEQELKEILKLNGIPYELGNDDQIKRIVILIEDHLIKEKQRLYGHVLAKFITPSKKINKFKKFFGFLFIGGKSQMTEEQYKIWFQEKINKGLAGYATLVDGIAHITTTKLTETCNIRTIHISSDSNRGLLQICNKKYKEGFSIMSTNKLDTNKVKWEMTEDGGWII